MGSMKPVSTLRQQDFDPSSPNVDSSHFYHRKAARAVVSDQDGAIALLHVTKHNYYKLPGGGIEDGEDVNTALERELLEEIGCRAQTIGEVGKIIEYRDGQAMVQTSYCFRATVIGKKGQPNFTQKELDNGFKIVWLPSIADAITIIEQISPAPVNFDERFMCKRELLFLRAAQSLVL